MMCYDVIKWKGKAKMYLEDDEARGKADTCNDCGNEGKWCSCGEDPDRSYKEGLEDE
jgi:hypothetical protein